MKILNLFLVVIVTVSAVLIAGCAMQPVTPPQTTVATIVPPTATVAADTIKLGATSLGNVLTDAKGMTLYFFVTDLAGEGNSTCYGGCARVWPVFSADPVMVSPPLNAADFSSLTRTDGTKQTTFMGRPLYYFQNDTKPGDVNGENFLKAWYVAKPDYTLMIASRPGIGAYLTDRTGKALYIWLKDTPGVSTCTGQCIATWPAFSAGTLNLPSVLKASDFSGVTRTDGMMQMAYMGRPLYHYAADQDGRDLKGQGIGNVWYAANVSGTEPAAPTPTTTVPTTRPPTTIPYPIAAAAAGADTEGILFCLTTEGPGLKH